MQVKNTTNPQTGQHVLPKRTRYYQAMLDVDALQKGQNFDLLPATYIIFICAFDFFGEGNYTYSFKKRCLETPELEFPDETTIILLNTTGTHGNISPDIKSFFDYVNQHTVTSDFTKEIDKEIFHIKSDQKARLEYMSLETYVQDNRYEAYAEGQLKANITAIKNIMISLNCPIDKAMDILKTPPDERLLLKDILAKERLF